MGQLFIRSFTTFNMYRTLVCLLFQEKTTLTARFISANVIQDDFNTRKNIQPVKSIRYFCCFPR
jgi:hypothetical protein